MSEVFSVGEESVILGSSLSCERPLERTTKDCRTAMANATDKQPTNLDQIADHVIDLIATDLAIQDKVKFLKGEDVGQAANLRLEEKKPDTSYGTYTEILDSDEEDQTTDHLSMVLKRLHKSLSSTIDEICHRRTMQEYMEKWAAQPVEDTTKKTRRETTFFLRDSNPPTKEEIAELNQLAEHIQFLKLRDESTAVGCYLQCNRIHIKVKLPKATQDNETPASSVIELYCGHGATSKHAESSHFVLFLDKERLYEGGPYARPYDEYTSRYGQPKERQFGSDTVKKFVAVWKSLGLHEKTENGTRRVRFTKWFEWLWLIVLGRYYDPYNWNYFEEAASKALDNLVELDD